MVDVEVAGIEEGTRAEASDVPGGQTKSLRSTWVKGCFALRWAGLAQNCGFRSRLVICRLYACAHSASQRTLQSHSKAFPVND